MSSFELKFAHLKIPLKDIQTATDNFADENIIGRGGFGKIYRGKLLSSGGELVDIVARRLDEKYGQGTKEFHREIMMLSSLKHQNLVNIVKFCDENGEKIIINKFEPKGSLDKYLSDPVTLTWNRRLQICLDIAHTLSYIHYDKGRSFNVIHRNIKSSKILLDEKWKAKLSGFGLSTTQSAARRHGLVLDDPCGTIGYIDPTYLTSGGVSHKSNVYSFGVVLFEVLTGMIAAIAYKKGTPLVKLAKSHYESGTLGEIIHSGLQKQIDAQSLQTFSEVAYCCLREQRNQRPNIDRVIFSLEKAREFQRQYENSENSFDGTSTKTWKEKDLEYLKIGYDVIKSATQDFTERYFIGEGGYGRVYKAELEYIDSSMIKDNEQKELPKRRGTVAIKYINDRDDGQGQQGFITEIETLASCKHPNVVSLLGFCDEYPHKILVYEFVSNGSLDSYLGDNGKMTNLTWLQRINICIDIARGLKYIHTTMGNKLKIIHRDIKSANILLGENWEAKIADFGLSKFHPRDNTKSVIKTNNVAGTDWYLDPEYKSSGNLKKETDVYSFGVVLFEIVSGKFAQDWVADTNENEKYFAPIVRQHFQNGTIKEMVDPNLKEETDVNGFILSRGPNQDSLNALLKIGYQCLAEKQAQRPTMNVIINELTKALNFQETHKDSLRISFEDISLATQNFNNQIGRGGFGKVYKGEILGANGMCPIAVKRFDEEFGQGETQFLSEIEILFEYKHENIVDLVGYCNEGDERILVYKYASKGSLDEHLKNASLTWTKRLKIGIDVAMGLDFLHGGGLTEAPVIHRDIKSSNILLNGEWETKITDFGLSVITSVNNEFDFVVDNACGTLGYVDPHFLHKGIFSRESDIYSLGVVLLEMICGITQLPSKLDPVTFVKSHYEEGKVEEFVLEGVEDKIVFEGLKGKIMPRSLIAFLNLAYECLRSERQKRPSASKVALRLKEALEFQAKDLTEMFSKGILLRKGRLCSLSSDEERSELVSTKMFKYENNILHKQRSIQKSRFQKVVRMVDVSNLRIQIKIKTQFLSPNVIYGAHLVFKFCDESKCSSELMYVNLKYQMRSETRHAYFATRRDDEWMAIELCRFIPHKKDVDFEVLIQSLSKYYCGSSAIYVEGIHFRVIDDASVKVKQPEVYEKLKGIQNDLESNTDSTQQVGDDYHEITQLHDGKKVLHSKKFLLLSNYIGGSICHMLPAKKVLYESSDVKRFSWKESRSQEVAELLSHQVLQIKCKIETQKLLPNTDYVCHLVFELSPKCRGLQCPVKVRDLLLRKRKEFKFMYFRSPRLVNVHTIERVPKIREDGLMEVVVWEFDSSNKMSEDHLPMSLKLRCYEGTMRGLIVYGIEIKPV